MKATMDKEKAGKGWIPVSAAAREWGMSVRRVRQLCNEWKIPLARKDKEGQWFVPRNCDRPVDSRAYRYRKVPRHLQDLVRHADALLMEFRGKTSSWDPDERWRFFKVGSAYHLFQLTRAHLGLKDVSDVLDGIAPGSRDEVQEVETELVKGHFAALEHLRKAVAAGRYPSVLLLTEFARCIGATSGRGYLRYAGQGKAVLAHLVRAVLNSKMHPLVKAGDFLVEMYLRRPLKADNERLGYLMANFILLGSGYPPFILYKVVFSQIRRYHEKYERMLKADERLSINPFTGRKLNWGLPVRLPPAVRRAFLSVAVIRAVIRSAYLGFFVITGK